MASLIEDMVATVTGVPAEHIHHPPLDARHDAPRRTVTHRDAP
jgi:hypothetical protein